MFYYRFRDLCESNGVSRSKAAQEIGLNRAAVAKWKNGAMPSGENLNKLATYFDVSIEYLLGKTDTKKAPTGKNGEDGDLDEVEEILNGLTEAQRAKAAQVLRTIFLENEGTE